MGQAQKILLVDDEVDVQDVISDVLELEGYDVTTASNAVQALECIKKTSFDLVISDMRMPKGNGVFLVDEINNLDCKPKVFILSGFSEVEDQELLKKGVAKFLSKPINADELCEEVKSVLGSP